ncbi:hypothetical protein MAHJHV54_47860 [Mycobacterium avium subsp. hominissuis]
MPGSPPGECPRGTTVYEIDRPRVLDFKAGVLRGLDARLAAGGDRVVAADLDEASAAATAAEQNRLLRRLTAALAAVSRRSSRFCSAGFR